MYDVRHLFATTALSEGADLKAVSKVLGHSSTKMTADTYYHLLQEEKQRAVNLIPPLDSEEQQSRKVICFKKAPKKRARSGAGKD